MKSFNELNELAKEYISKKNHTDAILFEPVFRLEDNKLVLAYMLVEFNDVTNDDYRIKRPTNWLSQDMVSGEIINYYNIEDKDFSNELDLPLDTLCDNNGSSIIFDYSNSILLSFKDWESKVMNNLKTKASKDTNLLYDDKTLKVEGELVSPKGYILANLESVIGDMYDTLLDRISRVIGDAYQEYYYSLFESIRGKYINDNMIDKDLIRKYMNYIKYLWPESKLFFNKCTNIPNTIDEEYDKAIDAMLETKKNTTE